MEHVIMDTVILAVSILRLTYKLLPPAVIKNSCYQLLSKLNNVSIYDTSCVKDDISKILKEVQ